VFTPIGLIVSSKLGLYTTMKCEAITHSLGDVMTQQNFPSCGSPIDLSKVVAVQANFHTNSNVSAGIQIGFSVGVLPAVLLHIIVAEYWIQTRFYSIKINHGDNNEYERELGDDNEYELEHDNEHEQDIKYEFYNDRVVPLSETNT
jgi:hypothetical protein